MSNINVKEPSIRPVFVPEYEDQAAMVDSMVRWFLHNFEDPANSLPYESAAGGYQWIWGGPFEPREELERAFPDATGPMLKAAVATLEDRAPYWTPASWRLPPPQSIDEARFGQMRYGYDKQDPNSHTIVETIMYPQQVLGWTLHVTFIPGTTNQPLGWELEDVDVAAAVAVEQFEYHEFANYRELLSMLLRSSSIDMPQEAIERSTQWLSSLNRDSEIFTADSIVVHGSPLNWMQIFGKGVDTTAITTILMHSSNFETGALMLLAYGGSRLFIRLVFQAEKTLDAGFELLQHKIKKGQWRE